MTRTSVSALAVVATLALAVPARGQAPARPDTAAAVHEHGHSDNATVHHSFEDAETWARRFEDPARDAWQMPDSVVALLADRPDLEVADIGSATGYFPVRFARACPRGSVVGADIEPDMVYYLNDRARKEGLPNLVSVLAAPGDPHLPHRVDLIFICDTYHHLDSRVEYFRRLADQLRPGARLAVVDFRPSSSMGPPHKLDPEVVVQELGEAGYDLATRYTFLPEQYFLVFRPRE